MPDNHQRLLKRLERQLAVLQSDKYIRDLGESLRAEIAQHVPVATGNMAQKVLRMGGPRRHGSRFEMWIGDMRGLGNANRAPRGTIAAFLRDFPQYRMRRKRPFVKSQAWWELSRAGKRKLQELRMAGLYGGGYQGIGSGKAGYFYQQEGSLPDWAQSAAEAGIHPTHFVEEAVRIWTSRDVPRVLAQFKRDLRDA